MVLPSFHLHGRKITLMHGGSTHVMDVIVASKFISLANVTVNEHLHYTVRYKTRSSATA